MVELKGSLGGLGLPAIVQLIGELHHSGTLELTRNGSVGVLAFDDGRMVAAEYGATHGLNALAAVAHELADADFTFVEAVPTLDRTLDLSTGDLKTLLNRVMRGDFAESMELPPVEPPDNEVVTCPFLGFADDRDRHYSRPTALHRCYASGAASLVTAREQRELCFGGRFMTCPRYRNVAQAHPAADDALEPPPTIAPVAEPASSEMPAGVAARIAATSQMSVAPATSEPEAAGWIGEKPAAVPATETTLISRLQSNRSVIFVAAGAILGLLLVLVLVVVGVPALNSGVATKPQAVTSPALEAVPTAKPAAQPTVAAKPTTAPAVAPTAVPTLPPPPTPTALPKPTEAPKPTVAVAGARTLMDVRFASGPGDRWLNNPPFAAWSDGAYRLQARQAARFVAVGMPINQILSDVIVSATFRKTGGPPGGGYGLIVRDQGPDPRDGVNQEANAYVLETGDLGEFGIWRRDGNHWVDLVPWTRSGEVRPGGSPNDLIAKASGNRLTFIVNGTQLASIQDDTILAGKVGLFVGGDYNEVALDRFSVQLPD